MHDRIAAEQTLAAEYVRQDDAVGPDVGATINRSSAACSGLMHAAVPRIIPACVIAGVVIVGVCEVFALTGIWPPMEHAANPKSSTFTVLSVRVPISVEIEQTTGRSVALASVYAALERLEDRGWVSSRVGESTAQRGGRAKRYFRVTTKGVRRVREAKGALVKMWRGIRELQGDLT